MTAAPRIISAGVLPITVQTLFPFNVSVAVRCPRSQPPAQVVALDDPIPPMARIVCRGYGIIGLCVAAGTSRGAVDVFVEPRRGHYKDGNAFYPVVKACIELQPERLQIRIGHAGCSRSLTPAEESRGSRRAAGLRPQVAAGRQ